MSVLETGKIYSLMEEYVQIRISWIPNLLGSTLRKAILIWIYWTHHLLQSFGPWVHVWLFVIPMDFSTQASPIMPSPGVCSYSCQLGQWCFLTVLYFATSFSIFFKYLFIKKHDIKLLYTVWSKLCRKQAGKWKRFVVCYQLLSGCWTFCFLLCHMKIIS